MEIPRRRLRLMSALLSALAMVIVVQLVKVQIVDHRFYKEWGREQRERSIAIADPPRGVIRDRAGHLLAGNGVRYSVEAAPVYVVDATAAATALSPRLHLPLGQVESQLRSDAPWALLAASVPKETGEEIASLGLRGITVRPQWVREYPEGSLTAYVTGFCNADGEGFYGVEGFYDDLLRPRTVEWHGPVDPSSEQIPWAVAPVVLPHPGTELVLTLDRTIQALAEEELSRSLVEFQAQGGTVIVLDARTFEILALVSLPDYDPARYGELYSTNPDLASDPAVSKQYEPGSVFKVLTVAAALDSGLVTPETTYQDTGHIEVGGVVVSNASHRAYGEQTVADILIKSLNVGAAWLSTQMGPDLFYRYALAFGIGRPTEVDLAGEVAGRMWLPDDYEHWHEADLATNAFGQGLAVTPIQMVTAIATVANDGARLRPHIVARRIEPDGQVFTYRPTVEAQVISTATARTLTDVMVRVVEEGVPQAQVPGYRVAGKTGTAQIPIPGGYDPQGTIVSFVGFGPVPDPQVVVLVKLERPRTSTWASETAARSFARLMGRLFIVLGVPPNDGLEVAGL